MMMMLGYSSKPLHLLVLSLVVAVSACSGNTGETDQTPISHTRSTSHVGGRTVNVSTPTTGTGFVYTEQIYVERLTPITVTHATPIILWTGLGQTGTSWISTPDGRLGWAQLFLSAGYEVYIADQPERGRSPLLPPPFNDTDVSQSVVAGAYASRVWTATQSFPNQSWPQAYLHTQWPGTGLAGDPAFETFLAAQVPSLLNQTKSEALARTAGAALLDHIGQPAVILTHSQGGAHGWAIADERPGTVRAIIAVEPQGPPFINQGFGSTGPGIVRPWGITQTKMAYDPPVTDTAELLVENRTLQPDREGRSECVLPAQKRTLANLAHVDVLLVTSEAGYHSVYDYCTVLFLREAGVPVEFLDLAAEGIHGNSHFLFMERNSAVVFARVQAWLAGLGV